MERFGQSPGAGLNVLSMLGLSLDGAWLNLGKGYIEEGGGQGHEGGGADMVQEGFYNHVAASCIWVRTAYGVALTVILFVRF